MKSILYFLRSIQNEELKEKYLNLYNTIEKDFTTAPAAVKYHHNWQGGLNTHTEQVINIAVNLFNKWKDELTINLDDVIIVSFIHDLDKMYKYELRPLSEKKDNKPFYAYKHKSGATYPPEMDVLRILAKHGISLTREQTEALAWHHGGWSDASKTYKSNSQLAAIVHVADLFSARVLKKVREEKNENKV